MLIGSSSSRLTARGPIVAIPFADWAINIFSKPKMKEDYFINLANQFKLSFTGTVAQVKERLNL